VVVNVFASPSHLCINHRLFVCCSTFIVPLSFWYDFQYTFSHIVTIKIRVSVSFSVFLIIALFSFSLDDFLVSIVKCKILIAVPHCFSFCYDFSMFDHDHVNSSKYCFLHVFNLIRILSSFIF